MTALVVGIVGAGALGTLFGWSLAAAHDVRIVARDARAAAAIAARGGLVLEGERPRAVRSGVAPGTFEAVDVVIVAVKSYDVCDALRPFRTALPHAAPLVALQNGAEAVAAIDDALGTELRIALAPTTEAATLLVPGVARRTAYGTTTLGWAAGREGAALEPLARTLNAAALATTIAAPIEPYVWAKLVVSAAINPLTALAGETNGVLLRRPELRSRSAAIAREVAAVAAAAGISLPFDDPVAHVEAVVEATAANRSSMLQDLERGGRTEIEAIAGTVVRRAAAAGIDVPETRRALNEVRARAKA